MKRNQSIQKAAALLRAAGDGEPMSSSALARASGLPLATALRLIHTLEDEGFLARLHDGDRLVVGPTIMRLAPQRGFARMLVGLARDLLERLGNEVRETVGLQLIHANSELELIDVIRAPHGIQATYLADSTLLPLHASATGKLALATYEAARFERFLAQPLERFTDATITDPDRLRSEIESVWANGYATVDGDWEAGLAGIAAGVTLRQQLVAAVGITGPDYRFDPAARKRAVEPLLRLSGELQRRLER